MKPDALVTTVTAAQSAVTGVTTGMPVPAAMITTPMALFVFLLAMVGTVFWLSEFKRFERFFHFFPPLIFCYFLPMLTTTCGITPEKNDLYDWFNTTFLPPILLLLLVSADLKAIIRLGPKALGVMLSASVGIMGGAVIGYAFLAHKVDPQGWKNIGALAASWTGGSANMFAVKAALEIPDTVFSPMVIVDSVFAYTYLGLLIALAGYQEAYERRFKVDSRLADEIHERVAEFGSEARPISTRDLLVMLMLAMGGGYLCMLAGKSLAGYLKPFGEAWPIIKTFSGATLTVIFVTALGIVLSFTPFRNLENAGASQLGYALLYMLLPTFGAQANLRNIGQVPWYGVIALGMLVLNVATVFLALRLTRAPLLFGAVGSQANVGGPASASVVASAYNPRMAPLGVLLGILGGIIGTYAGLLTAHLCKFFAPTGP
ncbi:MAG: DUF819 family protein [Candidatus Sumerlaeaceae bacterium]|nr:DUF819 family protein [Candidatus Sumerlaeaceae bacterium]